MGMEPFNLDCCLMWNMVFPSTSWWIEAIMFTWCLNHLPEKWTVPKTWILPLGSMPLSHLLRTLKKAEKVQRQRIPKGFHFIWCLRKKNAWSPSRIKMNYAVPVRSWTDPTFVLTVARGTIQNTQPIIPVWDVTVQAVNGHVRRRVVVQILNLARNVPFPTKTASEISTVKTAVRITKWRKAKRKWVSVKRTENVWFAANSITLILTSHMFVTTIRAFTAKNLCRFTTINATFNVFRSLKTKNQTMMRRNHHPFSCLEI